MIQRTFTLLLLTSATWFSGTAVPTGAETGQRAILLRSHLGLHRVWSRQVSPNVDSAPAYLAHPGTSASDPTIYVLAANNVANCNPGNPIHRATLFAIYATSGVVRWTKSTTGASRCSTAGPVVDSSHRWVYAPGLDGEMHRYNAQTGQETVGSAWPVTVTLMPDVEKIAATPTVSGHYLYVTTSGFIGDGGHYQGHLVTIDLRTGSSRVFNSLCSNIRTLLSPQSGKSNYCPSERSGFFGRGQGTVDPISRDVFVVSGNGPWNGKTNWGDSILKLNPNGTSLLDSFTPRNQRSLEAADADLGSTAPAMLAPLRQGGRVYNLLTQGGKGPACSTCHGAAIRLLNRDDLSGHGGTGHLGGDLFVTQSPGGCEVLTAPAVWKAPSGSPWVFYADNCGLAGYRARVSARHFRLDRVWSSRSAGTTPVVHGGVLYLASAGQVTAFDPATGVQLASVTDLADVHWQYPLVEGPRLFITDQSGHVSCYVLTGR